MLVTFSRGMHAVCEAPCTGVAETIVAPVGASSTTATAASATGTASATAWRRRRVRVPEEGRPADRGGPVSKDVPVETREATAHATTATSAYPASTARGRTTSRPAYQLIEEARSETAPCGVQGATCRHGEASSRGSWPVNNGAVRKTKTVLASAAPSTPRRAVRAVAAKDTVRVAPSPRAQEPRNGPPRETTRTATARERRAPAASSTATVRPRLHAGRTSARTTATRNPPSNQQAIATSRVERDSWPCSRGATSWVTWGRSRGVPTRWAKPRITRSSSGSAIEET